MRPSIHPFEEYCRPGSYHLLPFRFQRFDDKWLLVNMVGEHLLLRPSDFARFLARDLSPDTRMFADLKSHHFLATDDVDKQTALTVLATKYRTRHAHLAGFTGLHIFVVTLRCEHSCPYCQVSRVTSDRHRYDMSLETAERSLDLVFRSPSRYLKIEFQGGEPLLNLPLIRHIVVEARQRAHRDGRTLDFVVATNLALVDDEAIEFIREHNLLVSTSLDGPAFIHDANRPRPGGDSYNRAVAGIERVRTAIGDDRVSALMTTTRLSLEHPEEIVDEYVQRGFAHIFLRPLSPYGFAVRTRQRIGYEVHEFIEFYKRALDRIIHHNREGRFLVEGYAAMLFSRMLTPFPTGYVDLQSPAGAGIAVAVYNYDGDVYVSDEARMLAEMRDRRFRLGNVHADSYEAMFVGERLRALTRATVIESIPACSDCAFLPWCGVDPLENFATEGRTDAHVPTSTFHVRNHALITHLLRLYHGGDVYLRQLFWSWVTNQPIRDLLPAVP